MTALCSALSHALPNGSIVDGELVALDAQARPRFNLLQNASTDTPVVFFAFDLLRLDGEDLTLKPLSERRELLRNWLVPSETVQLSESFHILAERVLALVREHGLEGVVAKRLSSCYEQRRRSGAWVKMRVEPSQEFVIGGFDRSWLDNSASSNGPRATICGTPALSDSRRTRTRGRS